MLGYWGGQAGKDLSVSGQHTGVTRGQTPRRNYSFGDVMERRFAGTVRYRHRSAFQCRP